MIESLDVTFQMCVLAMNALGAPRGQSAPQLRAVADLGSTLARHSEEEEARARGQPTATQVGIVTVEVVQ